MLRQRSHCKQNFPQCKRCSVQHKFYISALQEAHKEIADLYPFWQLRQANLNYQLSILGVGYVKDGATDPLQSYHAMEFPITPATIQKAPRPAYIHEFNNFHPKLELAVYLDFTVDNPTQTRTYQMELNSKMELVPLTIRPKAGYIFVETTSSQSNESRLPGPSTHKIRALVTLVESRRKKCALMEKINIDGKNFRSVLNPHKSEINIEKSL